MPEPALGDWSPSDAGPWITKWDDAFACPHVMPAFGREHDVSTLCWCHPVIDAVQSAVGHNVAQ